MLERIMILEMVPDTVIKSFVLRTITNRLILRTIGMEMGYNLCISHVELIDIGPSQPNLEILKYDDTKL